MNWYLGVLKKYTVFSGRAQRAEYWYFVLFNMLVGVGLALIDQATGTLDPETGVGLSGGLYSLAVCFPVLGYRYADFMTQTAAAGGCLSC